MSSSSHTHGAAVHGIPQTRAGWFGVAVVATVAAALLGAVIWTAAGAGWMVGGVAATVVLLGASLAGRRGRDALIGFVSGAVVTTAGLYVALLAMAQFYAVAVQN